MPKSRVPNSSTNRRTILSGGPPAIDLSVKVKRHTFRFVATAACTDQPVYGYDLLGMQGAATTATGVTNIIAAIKIRHVDYYLGGTTGQTAGINWQGSYASPALLADVAIGTAEVAGRRSYPPQGSAASFWISYSERTGVFFTVNGPTNMVVDVCCDFTINNGTKLSLVTSSPSSGLSPGLVYFGPLDKNSGSPKLIPAGPALYYG